jgi:hypothetical protein
VLIARANSLPYAFIRGRRIGRLKSCPQRQRCRDHPRSSRIWRNCRCDSALWLDAENEIVDRQAKSAQTLIETVRRERDVLIKQVEESQHTIARSRELIERIDKLLAQLGSSEKS